MNPETAATPDAPPLHLADDPVLRPVAASERIAVLDVLRGFALLGICVINIPGFYAPWYFWQAGEDLYPGDLDHLAQWLVDFLGSGKFNSMFSFLFGVGFAIQMGRASAKGAPFVGTYLRRLLGLFLFGLAHLVFLWNGDVLHMYALLGLPLLAIRKLSDRWLWGIVGLTLLAPILHGAWELYRQEPDPHPPSYYRSRAEDQLRAFGRGRFDDLLARLEKSAPKEPREVVGEGRYWPTVRERVRETYEGYVEHGDAWFWSIMATTLTIGFIVGRRGVLRRLDELGPALRRFTILSGISGLVLAGAFATCSILVDLGARTPTLLGFLAESLYVLNRPILCAFYIGVFLLLWQRPSLQIVMTPLAVVGRMPLTNYLMQSIIHAVLFSGWGFGLFGRVGTAQGVLIAFVTYAVQVAYSNLWMRRFEYGPMEWLWRALTYGRLPRLTRPSPAIAGAG